MPNRIIKESIRESRNVNSLSDFEFRVWVHLITYADDYGRGSADPELLKGFVFPRRKGLTEAQISKALARLANTGMIKFYSVDGESYFCFPNWDKHQQIRAKKSKFPEPASDGYHMISSDIKCNHMISSDIKCNHMISSDIKCTRNPIQSESESESNPNPNFCAEPEKPGSTPESLPIVISLPLADKTEYCISEEQCHEWAGLYPAVDVIQQLRSMKGWLDANPSRRKTRKGIMRFINGWLQREQDAGRDRSGRFSGHHGGNAWNHESNGDWRKPVMPEDEPYAAKLD